MRAWLGAVLVALLPSCGLTSSFGDFDTSPGRYRITGTVEGLGDAKVTILVNGTRPGTVTSDGPFTTDAIVEGGAPFVVSVEAVPDGHVCKVENGTGAVVSADATGIVVKCPSTNAALASLSASVGPLEPGFASPVLDYAVGPIRTSLLSSPTTTTITGVAARADASIRVRGVPVASGTASPPIPIHLGKNLIDVVVQPAAAESTERRYSVTVDGTGVADFFKPTRPFALSRFGSSIALSGDTLVISERLNRTFVYRREGNGWSEPTIISENGAGFAIALDGDTLVIAAPFDSTTQSAAGAVFVYVRSAGGAWEKQAKITATTPHQSDVFGVSVSLSGNTLVVGASGDSSAATGINPVHEDTDALSAGAVYVFERTGTVWAQSAYVKASNASAKAVFGGHVTIVDDTIVATAEGESSGSPFSGAAYVFTREAGSWSQRAVLKAPNPEPEALFGRSVALSGSTLVVGCEQESGFAGAAYAFEAAGGSYPLRGRLQASLPRTGNRFGAAVAIAGDVIAVGATGESSGASLVDGDQADFSAPGSGAVYLFSRDQLTQRAYLKASEPHTAAGFGGALFLTDKMLVVGAPDDSSVASGTTPPPFSRSRSGAAYAFE